MICQHVAVEPVIELSKSAERSRYEARIDGQVVAFADYDERGSIVVLPHTVTVPALRGQGHAGRVVNFALDDIRASGRKVVASCWYVANFIDEHPDYADLLA
jgi:predicted GNAT family acetyltransferase